MHSTNEEIFKAIGGKEVLDDNKVIVYAEETSSGGNKSLFLIQKVKIKGLLESDADVDFAVAAFAGETRDRIVRAITTVPVDHPFSAGLVTDEAQIVLERNYHPFRDQNAQKVLVPSGVVLNPRSGEVSATEGQAIFEHRSVKTRKQGLKIHDFSDMRVENDMQTTVTREEVYEWLVSLGVTADRAHKAAQLDFVPQTDENVPATNMRGANIV